VVSRVLFLRLYCHLSRDLTADIFINVHEFCLKKLVGILEIDFFKLLNCAKHVFSFHASK